MSSSLDADFHKAMTATATAKPKIVVEKRNRGISRGSFGLGNKANNYQDITFSYAKKHFKPKDMRIEVLPWSPITHHIERGLIQIFTRDDLSGAKKYARHLIDTGASHFLSIVMQVYGWHYNKQDWHAIEEEHWEREDWQTFEEPTT